MNWPSVISFQRFYSFESFRVSFADHSISNLKSDNIDISDPSFKPHCSYIKEVALDAGVVLKPEEILEGVMFNGTERMILEAVKCFAEGLIRRAHHYAVCSGNYRWEKNRITSTSANNFAFWMNQYLFWEFSYDLCFNLKIRQFKSCPA